MTPKRPSGKRRAGVRGTGCWDVENTGCGGSTGSQWKTWGVSEKHGGTIVSASYEFSSLKRYFKLQ